MDYSGHSHGSRRDLIIGFMMAEIILIMIFILLLLWAGFQEKIRKEMVPISDIPEIIERGETFASFMEYVERSNLGESIKTQKNQSVLEAMQSIMRENENWQELVESLEERGYEPSSKGMSRVIEDNEEWQELVELMEQQGQDLTPETARDALEKQDELQELADAIKKQGYDLTPETIQKLLESATKTGGKGTDHPSCWRLPADNSLGYVFHVILESDGFRIRDSGYARYVEAKGEIPGIAPSNVPYEKNISVDAFERIGQLFRDFGREQKPECRFFVRAEDQTGFGPNAKKLYKERLKTLEVYFYKYLVN